MRYIKVLPAIALLGAYPAAALAHRTPKDVPRKVISDLGLC